MTDGRGRLVRPDISFSIHPKTYKLTVSYNGVTLTCDGPPYESSEKNYVTQLYAQRKSQRTPTPTCYIAIIRERPTPYSEEEEFLQAETRMGLLVAALLIGNQYHGRIVIKQPGEELFSWITTRAIRPPGIPSNARLWIGLLSIGAVKTIHDADYMHGDVKMENMILFATGDFKHHKAVAIDFEFAEAMQPEEMKTRRAQIGTSDTIPLSMGTPGYIAPESEKGYYSLATDIYALGWTLLRILCTNAAHVTRLKKGKEVWTAKTLKHLIMGSGIIPRQAEELSALISSMLARDRMHRPSCTKVRAEYERITELHLPERPAPQPRTAMLFLEELASPDPERIAELI